MRANDKALSSFLFAAVISLALCLAAGVTVYANSVGVYKDGVELTYSDVEPQIVNNRTMVPLAETAAYFGMTYEWFAETASMVFTGNGRTMVHTVNDNTIYVNGTPVEFEYTSIIVDGRTLMPIRMLAEAIGCVVEWDDAGIVDIWTDATDYREPSASSTGEDDEEEAPDGDEEAPSAGNSAAAGDIMIYSVTQDKRSIEPGETFKLSVDTNRAADRIKVTDFDGNVLAEVLEYDEDDQGRYFILDVEPTNLIGEATLKVSAGNSAAYSLSTRSVIIGIYEPVKNVFIDNLKVTKTVNTGDDFDILFYTSKNVKRAVVEDKDGTVIRKVSRHTDSNDNYYIWETWTYAESKAGDYTYTVIVYDERNDSDSQEFTITVKNKNDTTSNSSGVIQKVEADSSINYGARWSVFITTNNKAEKVTMENRAGELVGNPSWGGSSSKRTWEIRLKPEDSESFWIYAYDANGDEVDSWQISVTVN